MHDTKVNGGPGDGCRSGNGVHATAHNMHNSTKKKSLSNPSPPLDAVAVKSPDMATWVVRNG